MPVRLTIHPSSTPMRSAISPLGTTSAGEKRPGRGRSRCGGAGRRAGAHRLAGDRRRSGGSAALCMRGLRRRPPRRPRMRLPRRASTLPGPTSTNSETPAAQRSTVSRQRTGRVSAAASSARTSANGSVVAHETTGKRGSCSSTASSAARNGSTAGPIEGEWKAPATPSAHARLPRSLAVVAARSERLPVPGQHHLPGSVVVGDRDAAPAAATSAASSARGADQGEHRARVVGLGHQASAQHHERERSSRSSTPAAASAASSPSECPAVTEGLRSSASQPARLAQKMAGWAKRVLSSDAREGVLADELDGALEQVGGAPRDEVAHVGGLAALAGEQRGGRLVSVTKLTLRTLGRAPRFGGFSCANPPGGGQCSAMGGVERGSAAARNVDPRRARSGSRRWGRMARTVRAGAQCRRSTFVRPRRSSRCAAPSAPPRRGCAHAELAIQRGRVLLDRVRREEQPLGDLAVGGAGGDGLEHLALALGQRRPGGASCGLKTVMPRPTIRTAPAMSAAGQSLEMKPAAPAARAALGEIRPGAGDHQHVRAAARPRAGARRSSAPDSWPTNRSTSATCGS